MTLLWTEYRLAIYDLSTRKLVMDVLVTPEDMPPKARGVNRSVATFPE